MERGYMFFKDWREYGFKVALYNKVFTWLHRHDQHVRVW